MPGEDIPLEEDIPIPEGLDERTLAFVLEYLGRIALDYELSPTQASIDPAIPGSIDDFVSQLEEQIKRSGRADAEKEITLKLLYDQIIYVRSALKFTHEN